MMRVATEHQYPKWIDHASLYLGWKQIEDGQAEQGVACIREALAALRAAGQAVSESFHLSFLAQGYLALGQPRAGLAVIDEALAFVERTGERWFEAELHRLRGEFLLMQAAPVNEIEACCWQAIHLARQQQAKSWELRATMSLCRLWQSHGKGAEAKGMLSEVYQWFSEGFETPDLQDAKGLLATLG
jgi:adenylate cyclase